MPQLFLIRWNGATRSFEVLLQRRSGVIGDPYKWCFPGGSLSSEEKRLDTTPGTSIELKNAIRQRAALREFVEECGGDENYREKGFSVPITLPGFADCVAEMSMTHAAIPPSMRGYCSNAGVCVCVSAYVCVCVC